MKNFGCNSGKVASKWPPKTPFLDRFSKIFKKFSKNFLASSRHFWCLQMPYFGNFCTTPSLAAGPVWNSPYIFLAKFPKKTRKNWPTLEANCSPVWQKCPFFIVSYENLMWNLSFQAFRSEIIWAQLEPYRAKVTPKRDFSPTSEANISQCVPMWSENFPFTLKFDIKSFISSLQN